MRAVRITGPGTAEVVTVEAPRPADGEVLVAVAAAAVCTTDRKLTARGGLPGRTPGHEAAGYLPDGTPVGVHPDTGCGHCPACLAGRTNLCPDKVSIGIDRDGGFAGWVTVPAAHAVPLEGVPVELAPMLEPLACCVHAVSRVGDFDGPAVVVGAGAMGIFLMWALQADGHRLAVSQATASRREQATALGADVVMSPEEDVRRVLGEAPGAVFVTAPGAEALTWALENVADGGAVHAFAGTPGGALIDANLIHYRHLRLVGSTGSGLVDYRQARYLVRRGAVDLARLPHTRTDLDGAPAAMADAGETEHLRVLIDITGADR